MFLVEWNFHNVVFGHPHESLHSPIERQFMAITIAMYPFGFRPVSLGAVISKGWCFLHSIFHLVTLNYYRLIVRFSPSWSVTDYSTTMTSADFFQIPPRDGHPCLSGYTIPIIKARWGLAPVRHYSCRAYKSEREHEQACVPYGNLYHIIGEKFGNVDFYYYFCPKINIFAQWTE